MSERSLAIFLHHLLEGRLESIGPVRDSASEPLPMAEHPLPISPKSEDAPVRTGAEGEDDSGPTIKEIGPVASEGEPPTSVAPAALALERRGQRLPGLENPPNRAGLLGLVRTRGVRGPGRGPGVDRLQRGLEDKVLAIRINER